ncbi:MAG: RES family NAD+ phosphorylase [Solirubrobacteraceae bacterium]
MTYPVVAYRAADYETPLWSFPNLSSGRFNVADAEPATQYLSLHPMTPWAELIRNLDLRDPDEALGLRNPTWALNLKLEKAPLEITFDSVSSFGVDPAELVADDYSATRRLAGALYRDDVSSFTAPSAALPGTTNLVILRPAVLVDYHVEPVDPEYELPTSLVARDGRCPADLWDHVHYKGTGGLHAAFAAWKTGDDFAFEQPLVPLRT